MNKYKYHNCPYQFTMNNPSINPNHVRIQSWGTGYVFYGRVYDNTHNTLAVYLDMPIGISYPLPTAFTIIALEDFAVWMGGERRVFPYEESYDSATGYYTKSFNLIKHFVENITTFFITKKTYTTAQNPTPVRIMDDFDPTKIVSIEPIQGWLPANLSENEDVSSQNTKINPKNANWKGLYVSSSNVYYDQQYENTMAARYWRVENGNDNVYTLITKGNNVSKISTPQTGAKWVICNSFCDGIGSPYNYPYLTVSSIYDSITDTTTTTIQNDSDTCYIWFGNWDSNTSSSELEAMDPQLYGPSEDWNFGMLHSYGDITETTTTEITNRTNKSGAINVSNKTLTYSSSQYQSYWPITPGDTIAFKYSNTSTKTVDLYASSSQGVYTGQFYWFILSSTSNGTVMTPFPVDLHTETIDGEQYYVFEVPTGMNYLMVSYTPGSGAFYPSTYITAKVLKKETTMTKGWTDITNGNQGGSYP